MTRKNRITERETSPIATLSSINAKWCGRGLNKLLVPPFPVMSECYHSEKQCKNRCGCSEALFSLHVAPEASGARIFTNKPHSHDWCIRHTSFADTCHIVGIELFYKCWPHVNPTVDERDTRQRHRQCSFTYHIETYCCDPTIGLCLASREVTCVNNL